MTTTTPPDLSIKEPPSQPNNKPIPKPDSLPVNTLPIPTQLGNPVDVVKHYLFRDLIGTVSIYLKK